MRFAMSARMCATAVTATTWPKASCAPSAAIPAATSTQLCVVEQPRDLMALEQAGVYRGLYHVLLGRIAPLDGIGPDQLTIDRLVERVRQGGIQRNHHGDQPDRRRRRHRASHFEPARRVSRQRYPAGPRHHDRQHPRIHEQRNPGRRPDRPAKTLTDCLTCDFTQLTTLPTGNDSTMRLSFGLEHRQLASAKACAADDPVDGDPAAAVA